MAAYMGHVLSTVGPKILWNSPKTLTVAVRLAHNSTKKVKKHPKNFIQKAPFAPKVESIKSRGFLRNLPAYDPPENVIDKLNESFKEIVGTTELSHELNDDQKFKLLVNLNDKFSHSVPNSILFRMKTLGDVFEFYHTPSLNVTPYDSYKDIKLPPNLHIVQDYIRFHPDTDTMFGGVTAFPKSSTIVSGLRNKKKYKGHNQGTPWDDI